MADQYVDPTIRNIVSDAPITEPVTSPSDYEPCVGDVVEFEYGGLMCRGLIYMDNRLGVISDWGGDTSYRRASLPWVAMTHLSKISHIDLVPSKATFDEIEAIAKAYFSKPATPEFKAGDKVLVTKKPSEDEYGYSFWIGPMDKQINCILTIKSHDGEDVTFSDAPCTWPASVMKLVKQ